MNQKNGTAGVMNESREEEQHAARMNHTWRTASLQNESTSMNSKY